MQPDSEAREADSGGGGAGTPWDQGLGPEEAELNGAALRVWDQLDAGRLRHEPLNPLEVLLQEQVVNPACLPSMKKSEKI